MGMYIYSDLFRKFQFVRNNIQLWDNENSCWDTVQRLGRMMLVCQNTFKMLGLA
jgi:hypothetical protein